MAISIPLNFNFVFNNQERSPIPLTTDEAILAIGVLTLCVDPLVTEAKREVFEEFFTSMELFEYEEDRARSRIRTILAQDGPSILFSTASPLLDQEKAFIALDLAVNIVVANGKIKPYDIEFLDALCNALSVSQDVLQEIISNYVEETEDGDTIITTFEPSIPKEDRRIQFFEDREFDYYKEEIEFARAEKDQMGRLNSVYLKNYKKLLRD